MQRQTFVLNGRQFSTSDDTGSAETPGTANNQNAAAFNEVAQVLRQLKSEDGKSIDEMNIIHSLGVDAPSGTISIKLNLTKEYRKAKALITKKLQSSIPWAQKVVVEMAPKEQSATEGTNKRT